MSIYFIDIKATSVSERKCFLPFHAGRNPGGNQGGRGAGSRSRRIVEVSLLPVLRLPDLLCGGKDNWRSPRGMACDRTEAVSQVGRGKMPILLIRSEGRDGKEMTGRETTLSLHNLKKVADGTSAKRGNIMGTVLHGINVDQLVGTINAIKENPDLARFQVRAVTEWVHGGRSRTKVPGFL